MHQVTPKVFCIGESKFDPGAVQEYFDHIGTDWEWDEGISDSEALSEIMGRLCYRSWEPGMNPNVTKVRKGNEKYLGHIIDVGHGSVLEHPVSHWILADVSRIFTHEFVRHRAGMAFSQESLRFVRLTDLGLWLPPEMEADPYLAAMFKSKWESDEQFQLDVAAYLKLDDKPFAEKKKWTSRMRRGAPEGLATTIGVSMNMRSLRHIAFMRTHESAEEEIRLVVDEIMKIAVARWPNFFSDFERVEVEGIGEWRTEHPKV